MYPGEVLRVQAPFDTELGAITGERPANEQWDLLDRITHDRLADPDTHLALINYAADASTGAAMLVRMRALDLGLSALATDVETSWRDPNVRLAPWQEQVFAQSSKYVSRYFDSYTRQVASAIEGRHFAAGSGVYITHVLCGQDGLDRDKVFSAPSPTHYGQAGRHTKIPVAAVMLMDSLVDTGKPNGVHLTSGVMRDAAELALNFSSENYAKAASWDYEPTERVPLFARLARLARDGGSEHGGPIDALYALPDTQALAFAGAANQLYDAARKLSFAMPFPDIMTPRDAVTGMRGLIANTLFGLQYYVEHNNVIDTSIGWPDGGSFEVQEDDPLYLMAAMTRVFVMIREAHTNFKPEVGPADANFSQYRFINPEAPEMPQVSYHGRAHAGQDYDPLYEFSGDPTARFRVQLHTDAPIQFKNAEQSRDTVAIRVDYDRYGLAVDLGSLFSNPYTGMGDRDLEVRIGRFMALGNAVRARHLGVHPDMHHARLWPVDPKVAASFGRVVTRRHEDYADSAAKVEQPFARLGISDAEAARLGITVGDIEVFNAYKLAYFS